MNEWEYTPHHLRSMAAGGFYGHVRELLEAGVYVNGVGPSGYTALDCAIGCGHTEVADLLRKCGGRRGTGYGNRGEG